MRIQVDIQMHLLTSLVTTIKVHVAHSLSTHLSHKYLVLTQTMYTFNTKNQKQEIKTIYYILHKSVFYLLSIKNLFCN